jgi:hypothetical protein
MEPEIPISEIMNLRAHIDECWTPPEGCFCMPCPFIWGHNPKCEHADLMLGGSCELPKAGVKCDRCGRDKRIYKGEAKCGCEVW